MPKKNLNQKTGASPSFFHWIFAAIMVLFYYITPFQVALFNGKEVAFERPIYAFASLAAIVLFLLSIYFFKNWKLEHRHDFLSLFVWLIPLSYIISFFSAASANSALKMIVITVLWATAFLLSFYFNRDKNMAFYTAYAFVLSGYTVVLFGLMNWFGQAHYSSAVWYDANGARLTSVFQYPNTYAAFLIAVFFCSLHLFIVSKRRWAASLHAFLLVPTIVSLFLTLSRGGLVVLPAAFLFLLLFLPLRNQIYFIVLTALAFTGALIALGPVTNVGLTVQKNFSAALAFKGWGILLAASLAVALFSYALDRYGWPLFRKTVEKWSFHRWSRLILPIGIVVVSIVLLFIVLATPVKNLFPAPIAQRLENINFQQHSVLERATFYADAFKIVKDYPLFGAGGGAWEALYFKYQNNPYTSNQAHNFFMQYLTETGFFGLVILLIFLAWVFFEYLRQYIKSREEEREGYFAFFIVSFTILTHSIIDFDMSYVYISVLVFFCLGAMAAGTESPKVSFADHLNSSRWRFVYPGILAATAILVFYPSIQYIKANTAFLESLRLAKQGKVLAEVLEPLDKAIALHPTQPQYKVQKIIFLKSAYEQTKNDKFYSQALELAEQIKKAEPFSIDAYLAKFDLYNLKGELEKALELVNQAKKDYPWFLHPYEQAILLQFQLGEEARQRKDPDRMNRYWDGALQVQKELEVKLNELEKLPEGQKQGREFGITPKMALALGKIYFQRGDVQTAIPLFKAGFRPELGTEQDRNAALWYLAALRKTNQDDPALYEALKKADPEIDGKIGEIMRLP